MALKGTEHWMTAGAVWCWWLATARKSLTDSDWVQKWPIMPDIVYEVMGNQNNHILAHRYFKAPICWKSHHRVICDWLLSATVQFVGFLTCKWVFYKWSLVYSQRKLVVNTGSGPFVAQLCRAVTPLKVPSCIVWKRRASQCSAITIRQIISTPTTGKSEAVPCGAYLCHVPTKFFIELALKYDH